MADSTIYSEEGKPGNPFNNNVILSEESPRSILLDAPKIHNAPPTPPTPKRINKGRRKIAMRFIENKNRRLITFSKRKSGIIKKAYELSVLTGTSVLLLIASETGHVYTFATPKLQPVINNTKASQLIQRLLNEKDIPDPKETADIFNIHKEHPSNPLVPTASPLEAGDLGGLGGGARDSLKESLAQEPPKAKGYHPPGILSSTLPDYYASTLFNNEIIYRNNYLNQQDFFPFHSHRPLQPLSTQGAPNIGTKSPSIFPNQHLPNLLSRPQPPPNNPHSPPPPSLNQNKNTYCLNNMLHFHKDYDPHSFS